MPKRLGSPYRSSWAEAAYVWLGVNTPDQRRPRNVALALTTTVIGAYSAPDWYEPLDRLMSVGVPTRSRRTIPRERSRDTVREVLS
jgi:hypothetical protein